jgi:hypothetical protein
VSEQLAQLDYKAANPSSAMRRTQVHRLYASGKACMAEHDSVEIADVEEQPSKLEPTLTGVETE